MSFSMFQQGLIPTIVGTGRGMRGFGCSPDGTCAPIVIGAGPGGGYEKQPRQSSDEGCYRNKIRHVSA